MEAVPAPQAVNDIFGLEGKSRAGIDAFGRALKEAQVRRAQPNYLRSKPHRRTSGSTMKARSKGRGNRSDSGTLLQRQWALLQMLPRAPRAIDTPTLSSRLEIEHGITVLPRTLQRELLALTSIFPLLVDDSEKPYRWSWSSTAPSLSLPMVDPRSALLLLLVERHLKHALPPALGESLDPLADIARHALAPDKTKLGGWLRSVRVISRHLALEPPTLPPAVFGAVSEAMLEQRKVRVLYAGKSAEAKPLVVSPFGIVLKDGVGYLVGVVDGYEDVRIFALHRARGAEVLTERRITKKDFDLDDYIDDGGFGYRLGENITLKVRFSMSVARTVSEARLEAEQKVTTEADGSIVVTARVPDTQQLRSWLLGFGAEAEVLAPKALREWVVSTAQGLLGVYSKGLVMSENATSHRTDKTPHRGETGSGRG